MLKIRTPKGLYYCTLNNTQIEKGKSQEKDYTLSDGKELYLLLKPNGAKL